MDEKRMELGDCFDLELGERTRLLEEMKQADPNGQAYEDLMKNYKILAEIHQKEVDSVYEVESAELKLKLEKEKFENEKKIQEMKNETEEKRIEKEMKIAKIGFIAKIVGAVTTLGLFLLHLKQEITGSFRSKNPWFMEFWRNSQK